MGDFRYFEGGIWVGESDFMGDGVWIFVVN